MDKRPFLAALGFTMIFGLSFMFSRNALYHIDALHLLGFRFLLAALAMQLLRVFGLITVKIDRQKLYPLLVLGLFQPVMYFISETVGIQLTTASEAGMMVALIPIFTLVFARVFLQEKPLPPQVVAIIMSVLGVLLIGVMQASEGFGSNVIGLIILMGAPLAGAAFSVSSRHLSKRYNPVEMTYVMMHVGLFIFLPASIIQSAISGRLDSFFQPLFSPAVWVGISYLGLFSSVVAFFLMNYALSRLTASQVSPFPSLTTLIAVTASVTFLGETLQWYHFVGGTLIVTGVFGANYYGALKAARTRKSGTV